MNANPSSVEGVVTQVIKEIVGKKTSFTLSDNLMRDLRICSDDLSMYFVPEVERRLNVKVPINEWRPVETGHDACAVLQKHLDLKRSDNDQG
jgi:hypothetical protein